jgi:hypothetical protein
LHCVARFSSCWADVECIDKWWRSVGPLKVSLCRTDDNGPTSDVIQTLNGVYLEQVRSFTNTFL